MLSPNQCTYHHALYCFNHTPGLVIQILSFHQNQDKILLHFVYSAVLKDSSFQDTLYWEGFYLTFTGVLWSSSRSGLKTQSGKEENVLSNSNKNIYRQKEWWNLKECSWDCELFCVIREMHSPIFWHPHDCLFPVFLFTLSNGRWSKLVASKIWKE